MHQWVPLSVLASVLLLELASVPPLVQQSARVLEQRLSQASGRACRICQPLRLSSRRLALSWSEGGHGVSHLPCDAERCGGWNGGRLQGW